MRWLVPDPPPAGPWEDSYTWPSQRYTRACMVMAIDGSIAGPDGVSGSISSDTDRRVLNAARGMADAYLVGAGTVRAERYGPVRERPELTARRQTLGQLPAPTLVIVTASCRFDWQTARFQDSDNRPIILTTSDSDAADRAEAARRCDVVVVGDSSVTGQQALDALAERGLTRVNCEGGDRLLSELAGAGLLDEIDLTMSPLVTAAPRPERPGPAVLQRMRLHQLLEEDGYLFSRYLRPDD